MWICEQHGEQIPQHNGASYRCPLCTARVVWRDEPAYTADMAGSGQRGICAHCGKGPTPEGRDGCLGTLPESIVMNACCGHGEDRMAYVQHWSGECVRGRAALDEISRMMAEQADTAGEE